MVYTKSNGRITESHYFGLKKASKNSIVYPPLKTQIRSVSFFKGQYTPNLF